MRVTNDEARLLIYDIDIRAEKRILSVNESRIHELCTDLLEARETIERQEEIIKKMRDIIRRYVKLDTRSEVQDNLNSNATSILKKTKEYAE